MFRAIAVRIGQGSASALRSFAPTSILATAGLVGALPILDCDAAVDTPRANVILVTIDTVRADHLSCYGHPRRTSPHIDALAERGVLFESCVAQGPWTLPTMASIHTGLYPAEHGANRSSNRLGSEQDMLAEAFRDAGYTTLAVISNNFVNASYGFNQGFDEFDQRYVQDHEGTSSPAITDTAIELMETYGSDPFFLWVHYFDPHHDYIAQSEFPVPIEYAGPWPSTLDVGYLNRLRGDLNATDLDYLSWVYGSEIYLTDLHFGRLLSHVETLGLSDRTIVAVTSDHGEEFYERQEFGHGKKLYEELVHVPLVLFDPRTPGLISSGAPKHRSLSNRVRTPVEVRSLGRTLLDLAGADNATFAGDNLVEFVDPDAPRPVYAEGSTAWGRNVRKHMIREGRWKLIRNLEEAPQSRRRVKSGPGPGPDDTDALEPYELYDLDLDPGEKRNLYDPEGTTSKHLQVILEARGRAWEKTGQVRPKGQRATLSREEKERLRSLGYIK